MPFAGVQTHFIENLSRFRKSVNEFYNMLHAVLHLRTAFWIHWHAGRLFPGLRGSLFIYSRSHKNDTCIRLLHFYFLTWGAAKIKSGTVNIVDWLITVTCNTECIRRRANTANKYRINQRAVDTYNWPSICLCQNFRKLLFTLSNNLFPRHFFPSVCWPTCANHRMTPHWF